MRFKRVYIEITNACGLSCSFCTPKKQKTVIMDLETFEKLCKNLKSKTKEISLHVLGDPLKNELLLEYFEMAWKYSHKINLTTSGFYIKEHSYTTLTHQAINQINISLNSYDKNQKKFSINEYLEPIFGLIDFKQKNKKEIFINLRLWNLDKQNSSSVYNDTLFEIFEKKFNIKKPDNFYDKTFRLDYKVLVHFDEYFQWPSLFSNHNSHARCHGLTSQLAILSNGDVVPCCLDATAVIKLGNIHEDKLLNIINSQRALDIISGFKNSIAIEELCKKCTYKDRFKDDS